MVDFVLPSGRSPLELQPPRQQPVLESAPRSTTHTAKPSRFRQLLSRCLFLPRLHSRTLSFPLRLLPPSLPSSHRHCLLQLSRLLFPLPSFHLPRPSPKPITIFLKSHWLVPSSSFSSSFVLLLVGTVYLLHTHQRQNPVAPAPQVKSRSLFVVSSLPNNLSYFPPVSKVQIGGISPNQSKEPTKRACLRTYLSHCSGHSLLPQSLPASPTPNL